MSPSPHAASGIDRRRHPRYELLAQVRVHRNRSGDVVMDLVNISLSGALIDLGVYIRKPLWLHVGRELDISIAHPLTFDLVEVQAVVVRIDMSERGMVFAVEFANVGDQASEGLSELVRLAAEGSQAGTRRRSGPPPLPR